MAEVALETAPSNAPGDSVARPAAAAIMVSNEVQMVSDPTGLQAESIRVLRTYLIAQHLSDGRRSMAVCGSATGDGSTYIAANLAVALAQTGVNTLLIDGNMRDPGCDRMFVPPAAMPGLAQSLRDPQVSPQDMIVDSGIANLSLLYSGGESADAQELLGGPVFKAFVASCVRDYEFTIVDTPAANLCADSRRIGAVMRYALVVLRRNRSYLKDARTLINELQGDRVKVIGSYLNDY